jgi:hypothetical protein
MAKVTKQTKQSQIISVGFSIELPESINYDIWDNIDPTKYKRGSYPVIPKTVTCGVQYGTQCKGGLYDVHTSQENMLQWYERRSKTLNASKTPNMNSYIKKVYVFSAPQLIVTEIIVCNDKAFAFLAKPDTISTTQFKKCIVNGNCYGKPIHAIDLRTPIAVKVSAYIHRS